MKKEGEKEELEEVVPGGSWPLAPSLLVTLEAQHSLACHKPDALLLHKKTYMVLWV